MVEGLDFPGVLVGDGSDIGGGSSIICNLSGGGSEQVTIGERCLLGANAGSELLRATICVVEAGLYVTAGTKLLITMVPSTVRRGVVRSAGAAVPPQFGERSRRAATGASIVGRPERGAARRG